jgi:hypothetical protein
MDNPSPAVREYCKQRGFAEFVCEGGVDRLLRSWSFTVAEIEKGYALTFDDYLNDMDARSIINELLPIATEGERAKVEACIPALDNRFRLATRLVEGCIWGRKNAAKYNWLPDRDWWYYRVPTNLSRVGDDPKSWAPSA